MRETRKGQIASETTSDGPPDEYMVLGGSVTLILKLGLLQHTKRK